MQEQQISLSDKPHLVTIGTQCGASMFMCQGESARSTQHSGSLWVQGCLQWNYVELPD